MTDFQRRVLAILSDGPLRPDDIGERLWPNMKLKQGGSRGGPSRIACAASWQLGKLKEKTGWVETEFTRAARWFMTRAGREALDKDLSEDHRP